MRGNRLIRTINYELLCKTEFTTDILTEFKDHRITKEEYTFQKDKLNNYNNDSPDEYTFSTNSKYDEITQTLLIKLIISFQNHCKVKTFKRELIVNSESYKFIQLYENDIKDFKNKSKDK
jgi:hypothetical protein